MLDVDEVDGELKLMVETSRTGEYLDQFVLADLDMSRHPPARVETHPYLKKLASVSLPALPFRATQPAR